MTAPRIVDPAAVLGQALAGASPDLMRHLLTTVISALLSAGADAVCGAECAIPKLRTGTPRRAPVGSS
jgi:transposase-like protein